MSEIQTTTTGTHFGTYEIDSRDGDIVEVRGQGLDPDPSPIGQAFRARKSLRVERPAVRLSWLTNGPGSNNNLRGSDPFVEVSWEKVFELVAAELERVRDKHGNNSIFAGSYGWGSSGRVHAPLALLSRFLR
ncbi:MAG: molybdopterin-dependent oxidoreductase, partial [Acidimicrobiales bacterium]